VAGYSVESCAGSNCSNFAQIASPTSMSWNNTGLAGSTHTLPRAGPRWRRQREHLLDHRVCDDDAGSAYRDSAPTLSGSPSTGIEAGKV